MNRKQEILSLARRLFAEKGYNGVSMRDIAAALQISVGNVTYYFKLKEELIEAIVLDMQKEYKPRPAPQTLGELAELIVHIQELQEQFAFYFGHRTQLAQVSAKINEVQIRMLRENKILWQRTFHNLSLAGLIKKEDYPHQYEHLGKALRMVTMYWSELSKLEAESFPERVELKECVWGMVIPLLTYEGRKLYEREIAAKPQ